MNIEDCKVGMTVECKSTKYDSINKGDKLTIAKVSEKNYNQSYIYFEENYSNYLPKNFEPVNKFEDGDEVVWRGDKVEIWGIRYDNEVKEYEYAVIDKNNGRTLLFESELSPLKKSDELEVGDKFIDLLEGKYKVIAIDYDDHFDHVSYFVKKIDCNLKGRITVKKPSNIKEIIYD